MRVRVLRLLAASSLITFGSAAQAQQAPPPNAPNTSPSRAEVELSTPPAPPPSTAQVEARGAITAAPCALAGSDVRVTLTSIDFETPDGGPIAPELERLLAPAKAAPGGEQSVEVVCAIRDRVNALLNDAGYVALAQIPAQEIRSGRLRLQIVTAKIVEIRVLGDLGPFARMIETRIDALRRLDPLNRRDAERILLLTGDVPGVDVTLALSPAQTKPGEVIGTLTVETQRARILANVQNMGSRQLGRWIGSLRGEFYGLTGLADRTYLAYSNSFDWDEIRVVQAGHDFALTSTGLRAVLTGSFAWSRPDIPDLDLRSRSTIFGVGLDQTLLRDVGTQLRLGGGLEFLDQRTRIFQNDNPLPFTRDRLRVLYGRLDGLATADTGGGIVSTVTGYAEVRRGTGLFNATERGVIEGGFSPSRFDGNPRATLVRGQIDADIRTPTVFSLGLSAFGQWANDPLLNLEEFSLGNYTYGRGYDPGSNGGDRAIAFRIEPRVRLPLKVPATIELTGFVDWVRLYNLDAGTTERNRRLRSAGGGLRIVLPGRAAIDLTYAKPLDRVLRTDDRRPGDRFLISLTTQLLPWGKR